VEERRAAEASRSAKDDKWANLKAYRKSKGLCFTCGERWGREHQCKPSIQLHVVQEMIDYLQCSEEDSEDSVGEQPASPPRPQHLLMLSAAAVSSVVTAPRTMQLQVQIQGHSFLFLVDSGSSSCFIDQHKATLLHGQTQLPVPIPMKVAGGAILQCTTHFPSLQWSADGAEFSDTFKVLDLASYDGIIGLDWLGKYSQMTTHWEQGWLSIQQGGRQVVLHGELETNCTNALVEIQLLHEQLTESAPASPEVHPLVSHLAACMTIKYRWFRALSQFLFDRTMLLLNLRMNWNDR
jgi:hypothetical protein